MPSVLWTGRLSRAMKIIVNINNILAWVTGNTRNTAAMKKRMKAGYEGTFTDYVKSYDKVGIETYNKIATELIKELDLKGKNVIDVGCGTGALSLLAIERGTSKIVCGDVSDFMLSQCQAKAKAQGYGTCQFEVRQLDGESIPFDDNSFDLAISSMVLGLVPNQEKLVAEMARVTKPGGTVALAVHGPDLYYEAVDAYFRVITKRYILGYRIEFWPRKEKEICKMLLNAGLRDIQSRRLYYQDNFETASKAYEFFSCVSGSWWFAKFPSKKIASEIEKVRTYFERKSVTKITEDVILAYALKP